MIEFSEFMKYFTEHVNNMLESNQYLFLTDVDKDVMWNTYLDSYPLEYNLVYRVRKEMDCSCCRGFIKNFANVVSINDDNTVTSIWDFRTGDEGYDQMLEHMEKLIKSSYVFAVS